MIAILLSLCLACGCIVVIVAGMLFIMVLSFGALDDCHVVVILLSFWSMLACCCHCVVMLVHWMLAMLLPCCFHLGPGWPYSCHFVVCVLSFWSIG